MKFMKQLCVNEQSGKGLYYSQTKYRRPSINWLIIDDGLWVSQISSIDTIRLMCKI